MDRSAVFTSSLVTAPFPGRDICGVYVHGFMLHELLDWMIKTVMSQQRATVYYANAHAINLAQTHPDFRRALNAAQVVFCDGYGVWLAARWLGHPLPQRFTPPDWIEQLANRCATQGYSMMLLGARSGIAQQAAERLMQQAPGLTASAMQGYFDPCGRENDQVIDAVNASGAQVLLVGMGMPQQELWIHQNRSRLNANLVLSVGALLDYLAGSIKRGPRWLTDSGFEWLTRLYYEPARLWRRYVLGNPQFLWLVLQQWLHERGL